MEVDYGSFWKATGRIIGEKKTLHPLNSPSGVVDSPEGKTEVFVDSVEEQFTPARGAIDAAPDFLQQYFAQPLPNPPILFELAELQSAISRLDPKRACVLDGIGVVALKSLLLLSWNIPQLG